MTPQIKQRIEQIWRGEVPEGYKKTKVGIIPAEWIVKLLSDVFQKQNAKNTTNAVNNVLTNSATQGIISQMDYFDKRIANDENTASYYLVYNGCFVYNPRISTSAPCGPFNRYNGLEMGIMSPLYTVYIYKDSSNSYSDYLSYFFSSSKWHGYMNGIANYGARSDRMNVTIEDMNNLPLPYPTLAEQEKIAEILETQNRVIELCEKKVEQLKKLKKVFLQKMFPKPGATVPEWRFPGFTDAWEQRKFGELYKKSSEKNDGSIGINKNITVATMQYREDVKVSTDEYLKTYYTFKLGDIAFEGHQSKDFRFGRFVENDIGDGIVSHIFVVFRPIVNYDLQFWKYAINNEDLMQKVLSRSTKASTMMHDLVVDDFLAEKFLVPAIEEQRVIGSFLASIDKAITLHQRKCDEEKQKKKALMQLLLTGIVRVKI